MKIALAQVAPYMADSSANIRAHLTWVEKAVASGAQAIFFPELSITGYEPALAGKLAFTKDDERLLPFQEKADEAGISIGIGVPTKYTAGICISMHFFHPHQQKRCYSKQFLHADERPFFVPGYEPMLFALGETAIAPAICYESLQPSHLNQVIKMGAGIYLASVAKPTTGLEKAQQYFASVSATYKMPVLMVNCVGPADNFVAGGGSAIWSPAGEMLDCLGTEEGLLLYDE